MKPPNNSARASRRVAFRDAASNANIAKAEMSLATGIVGQVAWLATMVVVTFDQIGPIGPGIFIVLRQFAGAAGAPFYAALLGRFRHERLLASAIFARGLTVALTIPVLQLHGANVLLFLLIAAEGLTQSAPNAIHDALLPRLADSPAQLVAANAISSLVETSGRLVGAGVAAVALWLAGPSAVLITIAVLAVVGGWLLLSITATNACAATDGSNVIGDLVGGVRILHSSPRARVVVIVMAVTASLTGIAQSIAPSIATDLLHIGSERTPVLIGAVGLGGLLGGVASLSLASRPSVSVPLILSLVTCVAASFAISASSSTVLTIALLVVFGIAIAYQVVCGRTLLQNSASGRSLDLLVGINAFIGVSIVGVAAFCGVGLNAAIGIQGTLLVSGGLVLLAVFYAVWRLPRLEPQVSP